MDDATDADLPRGVALAWGVAADPQRGPKRELNIERIVEAAVGIADAEGLGAVSMSAIAAKLGVTTMALYRYVSAKDDLILLMQEYGTGLPGERIEGEPWREAFTRWARETLAQYAAHPWLIDIPITGTPMTPNSLSWMDAALGALRETPLSASERMAALVLVTGQTRWEATVSRGYDTTSHALGMTAQERDRAEQHVMEHLVTADAFPDLHAALMDNVIAEGGDPFRFGLDRVLDGIERYIAEKVEGATPPPPEEPLDAYPRDPAVKAARQLRREAQTKLREAQRKEREAIAKARDRARQAAAKARP